MMRDIRMKKSVVDITDEAYFRNTIAKTFDVGRKLEYLLATGNLISPTGLGISSFPGTNVVIRLLIAFCFVL